ncbi:hypothetical protein JHK82_014675 [Glycine max]|uniref:Uncharacterized protein n=2 Tax=Glycine subgen. Soja TaxID=1462606 RepID=K7KTS3_SOYBN|nr:hypothetical protein JHK87_014593 [Glycine soja]KAG5147794.1 hypothetical protein JHK82_014675 [Glycine max]KAH1124715.1 hypothetical protein GYH30_014415 [Glycine max]KRH52632.1 hypothetical protein GLYMA_06G079300v4 [Glycine max]RZC06354.1 hypothetical protein D0Y65_014062 [Glycine soja]
MMFWVFLLWETNWRKSYFDIKREKNAPAENCSNLLEVTEKRKERGKTVAATGNLLRRWRMATHSGHRLWCRGGGERLWRSVELGKNNIYFFSEEK